MQNRLLMQLKSDMENMSGVEKKIARIIIENPEKFISLSITELSELTGVSQGSIINFSKKFSGGGFPLLKLKISGCLSEYSKQPFSIVSEKDSIKDVFGKTLNETAYALQNTKLINDAAVFKRAAERILKAKKVELYGAYRSGAVATDFYYQLLQLGIPASFVSDSFSASISATLLDKDCLLIVVSASGETTAINNAAKQAKLNGVPVVAITGHRNSVLAEIADDVLIAAASGTSLSMDASEIRLSQLVITDALCSYVQSKIDGSGERYFKLKSIAESHSING